MQDNRPENNSENQDGTYNLSPSANSSAKPEIANNSTPSVQPAPVNPEHLAEEKAEQARLRKYFSYRGKSAEEKPQTHISSEDHEVNSDSLYLSQLEFKKRDSKTFLNYFVHNFRIIVLIIIGIFVIGGFSFTQLPLESQPEVTIPYGIVSVGLPGASPSDVEELIVKPIEEKVVNLEGVKQVSASALNSVGVVTVEFRAEEDLADSIRRLRDAVETVKADLPTDASDPVVNEVSFSESPVWTMVLTGPYDNFTLRKYAELVEDELKALAGTSKVLVSGGDISELRISFSPQKLQNLGLTMDQALNSVRANNLTLPLGTVNISNFEYNLRLDGKYHNAQELRDLPISTVNDSIIRLKDVASVVERATENNSITRFSLNGEEPQNAITINVVKKTGASIITLIDDGKLALETLRSEKFPDDLVIETTLDYSEQIRDDFNHLQSDGLNTVILVFIVLFLFVGLKEAFVAGTAIPLVFAVTFGIMYLVGMTLNFLSLFSLILTLGFLVDDAIVVVQATKQYLATGRFTPEQAVLLVFRDYKTLILTTSLATIFAFLPLVLASGIIGQFIRSIPITVSATIVASTIIAILINHPMGAFLERFKLTRAPFKFILLAVFILLIFALISLVSTFSIPGIVFTLIMASLFFGLLFWYRKSLKAKLEENEQTILEEKADDQKIINRLKEHYSEEYQQKHPWVRYTAGVVKMDRILPFYDRILNKLLTSKFASALALLIALVLFIGAVALPVTGVLKSEFLPPSDSEIMYINIEGPAGLVLTETKKISDQVQAVLLAEPNIESFSEVIGASGVNTSDGGAFDGGSSGGQGNRAQFAINLLPLEERVDQIKSYNYAPQLREKISQIKGANIEVVELSGGPPSGAAFQVSFLGDDFQELEKIAEENKAFIANLPGTINEKISITLSPGEFTFRLKPDQLALRGLSSAQIATTLRTAISSSEVAKVLTDGDDLRVIAEFDQTNQLTLNQIQNLTLVSPRGQTYQLSEVADIEIGSAVTSISRLDQKRVITLTAGVEAPALPADVLAEFQKHLESNPLPAGYEVSFGGENEASAESIYSILRAMIVAFLLIIITLVLQFNSFRKAALILVTIPLAITGVFFGSVLLGFTLSFPSLIGILALFGIVVKNAIILVDKINLNIKVGIPFRSAIIDAAKSRLEAIFLTSVATIIGMIPITLSNETWEGLGAALIFGLSTSTFLTLLIIPILYNILFRKDAEKQERLRTLEALVKAGHKL
ncbi:MAG: efflux RND transporter permease subunit [Candidatus Altimarinota bacterium]